MTGEEFGKYLRRRFGLDMGEAWHQRLSKACEWLYEAITAFEEGENIP